MSVKIDPGTIVTVNAAEGMLVADIGTYITSSYKPNGYPHGVQDFRGLTAIQCVDQLEQALKNNPELAKAIELMNSKLYKALK